MSFKELLGDAAAAVSTDNHTSQPNNNPLQTQCLSFNRTPMSNVAITCRE
jgi:hypothetical protein